MFKNLRHKRETFSYTMQEDEGDAGLRPLVLKLGEESTYSKVEAYVSKWEGAEIKADKVHHEIFVKQSVIETTFLFTTDEKMHTILSVTTYATVKGVTYDRLVDTLQELKALFKDYIVAKM